MDGLGGPGQKTSNLSPCPVPLVVKLNVKCRGSVETDAYLAEFGSEWTDGFEGIRLEGLKLALVQNYKSTVNYLPRDNLWFHCNCRAIDG